MTAVTARMDYAQFDMYGTDADHHIDLANPNFRQDVYLQHMQQQQMHAQAQAHHHLMQHPDFYPRPMPHAPYGHAVPPHLAPGMAVDVKPRLTKEQHDILEAHYQGSNKPNTNTKKTFAESLGVSLDKVNNWFQNRRAKSKQDAKKAAAAHIQQGPSQSQQEGHTPSSMTTLPANPALPIQTSSSGFTPIINAVHTNFTDSDFLHSPHTDSAISIDPIALSGGLGISRNDDQIATTMAPQDLMNNKPVMSNPNNLSVNSHIDEEKNRRTLTQEQFDTFASHNTHDFATAKSVDSAMHQSPKPFDEYLNDMSDFSFGDHGGVGLTSNDIQSDFNLDTFRSSTLFPDLNNSGIDIPDDDVPAPASVSEWSEHSTPALNITPIVDARDSGYAASDHEVSPKANIGMMGPSRWQPGSSEPVDFEAMDRGFREAAARAGSQSTSAAQTRRSSSVAFSDHHMGLGSDGGFAPSENSAGLTQSMNNMGLNGEKSHPPRGSSLSGGIAGRRQRPRPQPLTSTSLRSTSYCGSLPTAPSMPANSTAGAVPTLRRIKSSNVMGGIANGRIQKSVAGAQRSPMSFSFAEAMNSPKFRRVSSYSPANGMSLAAAAALAPPTPLTPTEMNARLEMQRQTSQLLGARAISRQPSIQELREDDSSLMSNTPGHSFSSPPNASNYATQYARSRLGVMAENTPPQSAPASQQSFGNAMYGQSFGGLMAQQGFPAPVMAEHSGMAIVSGQPMQPGQYLEMMQMQQQMGGINGMLPASRPLQMAYAPMSYSTGPMAPNVQYSLMPGAMPGMPGGHAMSKSMTGAEFYVHEFKKPMDERPGSGTPRKMPDAVPKSYTFANHGPEHYEKIKTKDMSGSPSSSPDQSATS